MMEQQTGRSVDTGTVLYGVLGDPIAHSKSPLMMNAAFRETGINAVYAAFRVRPDDLPQAIAGLRALGFRGVNVTVPHKVAVMDHLDEIDEDAQAIGAVNTIVNDGGRLIGRNTDGIGYVRSLREETGTDVAGKRVLLLGAGGAARGIAYAFAKEGASRIVIVNRTAEKAKRLADELSRYADVAGFGTEQTERAAGEADIIVNTTTVGMHPDVDGVPIDPELLGPRHLVSDIVYNPLHTRLLKEAQARGAQIHAGLGMFIYQGAYAFEYWTGTAAPTDVMRQVVEASLGRQTD